MHISIKNTFINAIMATGIANLPYFVSKFETDLYFNLKYQKTAYNKIRFLETLKIRRL